MATRIGILGGTFDPIHYGHLAIAEEARVALLLEQIIFIPARYQPLKHGNHAASPEQRLLMVRLACANNPAFEVSAIEVERPGPSYTITTLEALAAETAAELTLIVGIDALTNFDQWHAPEQIMALARIAGIARPGIETDLTRILTMFPQLGARLTQIAGPKLEISSSEIRQRIAAGRPIRYLTPDPVVDFIAEQGLYGL
jgi:nicotinate-nucleotide adenylyltransferase